MPWLAGTCPDMPFGSSIQDTAYVSHSSGVLALCGECVQSVATLTQTLLLILLSLSTGLFLWLIFIWRALHYS